MDEALIKEAALALAARLKNLLDASMANEIILTREEALLAQGFAQSVADLLVVPPRHG
ncbi:hypothetical protein [Sphingomonas koreensis]|jgi:hypothetical protein|uniref:hypothetical protein n=1 Tax=Sphingomonas koreensis TaxID=93064 RepID=UPI00234EE502|nr:hypothetical protein [Sphingomonas koreensis]MDC7812177.1 hypothetical protein [Sphingomonas koreensis]